MLHCVLRSFVHDEFCIQRAAGDTSASRSSKTKTSTDDGVHHRLPHLCLSRLPSVVKCLPLAWYTKRLALADTFGRDP